ncbi:hypothetical protein GGI21_001609 [Coemansia aciculifera]|uniref:Uncharacterized protein n=1 Tax=Coemansia aciculifera TaxID=417176 RepID=A0ACC1MA32_9FUNG|nr:hypothetical protein IWW38_000824 [Coemansia aciculifera]KAJ2909710.1 hypothetical protein GGI21_001609 [Coemansia aciculifera]
MPRTLQLMHWLLYNSVVLFAVVVTLVFWSLIYKPKDYQGAELRWSTASVHALNSVFVLVDMIVGAMVFSPHWSHSLLLVVVGLLYFALAFINRAVNGWFTYDFLNYDKHGAIVAATIVGIVVGCLLIYYVIYALQLLLERYLPPKFATPYPPQDSEEEEETIQMEGVNNTH